MSEHQPVTRRRFLIGIGAFGAVAAGMRVFSEQPPPTSPPATTQPATTVPSSTSVPESTTTTSAPPEPEAESAAPPEDDVLQVEAYEPDRRDVYREVKQPAGVFVQALALTLPGETATSVVERAIGESGARIEPADLERAGGFLFQPAGSVGEVVYAQLGGLSPQSNPTSASVMVVCRQASQDGARMTRTLDVRMALDGGSWHVVHLASVGGAPVPRPADLSDAAEAVLDDPRIDLPDSARWDIHEGLVDDRLLRTMSAMADRFPFSVTCLRNGHPVHVFGTQRTSHHTRGAAVDVWGVDGTLVAAQQPEPGSPAHDLHTWLFEQGVPELGGPWDLDGRGGPSFTNEVHLDHLHVAFKG